MRSTAAAVILLEDARGTIEVRLVRRQSCVPIFVIVDAGTLAGLELSLLLVVVVVDDVECGTLASRILASAASSARTTRRSFDLNCLSTRV